MLLTYICCSLSDDDNLSTAFTPEELDIDPHVLIDMGDIALAEMIGSGSFAVVYRGFYRKTEVAVKILQNMKNEKFTFFKRILSHAKTATCEYRLSYGGRINSKIMYYY
jgi:hypothetical protein